MLSRPCSLLLAALALVLPAAAAAAPSPSPANSSVEPILVGSSSGLLIGDGYRVIVRDPQSRPLADVTVEVNFSGGIFPYSSQLPPTSVDCAPGIISQLTDANGLALFRPRCGGTANFPDNLTIKANGIYLANATGRSTDYDASGATELADFNHFRVNFLTAPASLDTDYDESGVTDLGDLSIFRQVFLADTPGGVCF